MPLTAVAASADGTGTTHRATPGRINGAGSTYVALAMQQWTADAQSQGLSVNYTPTGSPDGLARFAGTQVDYAGTEAEFSSLQQSGDVARGFQYVPDVAGAVAVMYNVDDKAGRKIDYLHLSRRTIARIFTGSITTWADPAISADNKGLKLPAQPINVVYRSGQSGTTALFYDFVANTAPDIFGPWARRNQLPTSVRIIQLDSAPNFAPNTQALGGSDQIAQYVAGSGGKWSIAYDEFGYARTYGATAAWVQNQSGAYVLPYAENISAALESARLRPDLSQELSGVYASRNPKAYPISAYSYVVTQCAPTSARPTCRGAYTSAGVAETLTRWMRYIACEGQVNMAQIGYSPLPPNLSQEIVNSVVRMVGSGTPLRLTASNCANPRFRGSVGAGGSSPPDPLAGVASLDGGGSGGGTNGGGSTGGGSGGAATGTGSAGGSGSGTTVGASDGDGSSGTEAAVGRPGGTRAVGGGSAEWRTSSPVAYTNPDGPGLGRWALLTLLGGLAAPTIGGSLLLRRRARR